MSMDPPFAWALGALLLIVVELLTGTFYLLVLAVAAFGAAGAAWLGQALPVQAVVAAVLAGIGVFWVHVYRARNAARQMPSIDAGQPANFEQWIDRAAGLARVRYRGASWEARLSEDAAVEPGAIVYVLATEGNTLKVSTRSPS